MQTRNFVIITQKSAYPQMGALYLANALMSCGIRTHIISSNASNKELDILIERVDPIAVGCSVMTAPEIVDFVRHSMHVQHQYNSKKKTMPIIWGGMHSTIMPDQTAREPYIDFVVAGEAEVTLPRILLNLADGKSPSEKLVRVRTPAVLDTFEPQWEAIDLADYVFPESRSVHADVDFQKQNVFYYLLSSRGCTYKCNFCWEVARTEALRLENPDGDLSWRAHSAEWVERQIDYVACELRNRGVTMDGVGLWDDMIFGRGSLGHTKRARCIFTMMRARKFGYLLEARANQLISTTDKWNDAGVLREADLYKFLKETGCMQVFVGTESGSQETLNMIQKGTRVSDYMRLVAISREVKLPLRFSMIVGFPQETENSINATLDLIEHLEGEPYISISGPKLFTPYPGTPQYVAAVNAGMKVPQVTLDWARLNRYTDYRHIFPWLEKNHSKKTLNRIDAFFAKVSEEKRHQADEGEIQALASEEAILKIVREH
ncbi:MAG: radical SAM protein [Patescibacteria group bacterium]